MDLDLAAFRERSWQLARPANRDLEVVRVDLSARLVRALDVLKRRDKLNRREVLTGLLEDFLAANPDLVALVDAAEAEGA